jgi:beta-aspartyl-dipeptidase (metallo-type)
MFVLIETVDIYDPDSVGVGSILLTNDVIVCIGEIDRRAALALDPNCRIVDGRPYLALPGLVDPHAHLIGAAGKRALAPVHRRSSSMSWPPPA